MWGSSVKLGKLEGSEGTNVLHFKLEDNCLLTSRTTVGSDNFFNFNQFPHLRNLNKMIILTK